MFYYLYFYCLYYYLGPLRRRGFVDVDSVDWYRIWLLSLVLSQLFMFGTLGLIGWLELSWVGCRCFWGVFGLLGVLVDVLEFEGLWCLVLALDFRLLWDELLLIFCFVFFLLDFEVLLLLLFCCSLFHLFGNVKFFISNYFWLIPSKFFIL